MNGSMASTDIMVNHMRVLSIIAFYQVVTYLLHILIGYLPVIHYTICGAVCFQFTHSLCDDWENIYTLSYYHHQIGIMNYYPLFRVRSWNNGMRCMSFYILIDIYWWPWLWGLVVTMTSITDSGGSGYGGSWHLTRLLLICYIFSLVGICIWWQL